MGQKKHIQVKLIRGDALRAAVQNAIIYSFPSANPLTAAPEWDARVQSWCAIERTMHECGYESMTCDLYPSDDGCINWLKSMGLEYELIEE